MSGKTASSGKDPVVMVVSTEDLPGPYEVIGICHGVAIRANAVTTDVWQMVKNITGGELVQYGKLISRTAEEAVERMMENAATQGANGIIGVKFSTSNVVMGGAEIIAYGTAVRFLDGVDPATRPTGSTTAKALVEGTTTSIYRFR